MVLAVLQELLEELEAGGIVVDGEHAHADGELVLGPMAAAVRLRRLQLHVLDGHLLRLRLRESNSTKDQTQPTAPGSPKDPVCRGKKQAHNKGVSLDPRNPRNGGERRIKRQRGQSRGGEQHQHRSREREMREKGVWYGEEPNNKGRGEGG